MGISTRNAIIVFFTVCIGFRSLMAFAAYKASTQWLKVFGVIGMVISAGFMFQYLNKSQSGSIRGEGMVWWNDYRIVHSIMYFMFGLLALFGNRKAYVILILDVLIGIFATANNYFM